MLLAVEIFSCQLPALIDPFTESAGWRVQEGGYRKEGVGEIYREVGEKEEGVL